MIGKLTPAVCKETGLEPPKTLTLQGPMGASLVFLAAFCNLTQLVKLDALIEAMRASVPSYRQQHVESNARALQSGWALLPSGAAPAWGEA